MIECPATQMSGGALSQCFRMPGALFLDSKYNAFRQQVQCFRTTGALLLNSQSIALRGRETCFMSLGDMLYRFGRNVFGGLNHCTRCSICLELKRNLLFLFVFRLLIRILGYRRKYFRSEIQYKKPSFFFVFRSLIRIFATS